MNIADIFIRRPIMTSLIMIAIFIFGAVSYRLLPVNDLPNVDFPTIQVNANLPGANPDTMASAVATPLENQLSNIAGVDSMTSTNGVGTTRITLQFNLDRDIDAAAQDQFVTLEFDHRLHGHTLEMLGARFLGHGGLDGGEGFLYIRRILQV